jgi:hypothetical protein
LDEREGDIMAEIAIEFEAGNENFFTELLQENPENTDMFRSEGFDGAEQLSQFVAILLPVLVPAVSLVIVALINAQKTFRIKIKSQDGAEVELENKGYSAQQIKNMLSGLSEKVVGDKEVSELICNVNESIEELE